MITLSTFGLRESERERLFVGRREMKIQEMRRSRESSIWFGEKKRERESFCWSLEPGAWSWYAILCILCPYNQSSFAGSMSPPYPNTPKPNISISSPFHVLSLSLSLSLKNKIPPHYTCHKPTYHTKKKKKKKQTKTFSESNLNKDKPYCVKISLFVFRFCYMAGYPRVKVKSVFNVFIK